MKESCFCGRTGEVEDRKPVLSDDGQRVLKCPSEACGHVEDLRWLPEQARRVIWEKAIRHHDHAIERQGAA